MAAEAEPVTPEEGASQPQRSLRTLRCQCFANRAACNRCAGDRVRSHSVRRSSFLWFESTSRGSKPKALPAGACRTPRTPGSLVFRPLPQADLQSYKATYDRVLGSYSWVDRAKGIAAIPLDRAMQIASQRGIPRSPPDPSISFSQPAREPA